MTVKIAVVMGDITAFEDEAIVNSANRSLLKGSGLCKVIYEKEENNLWKTLFLILKALLVMD